MDYKIKNDILRLSIQTWTELNDEFKTFFNSPTISSIVKIADIYLDYYFSKPRKSKVTLSELIVQPEESLTTRYSLEELESFIDCIASVKLSEKQRKVFGISSDLENNSLWKDIITKIKSDEFQNFVIKTYSDDDTALIKGINYLISENRLNRERLSKGQVVLGEKDVDKLKRAVREKLKKNTATKKTDLTKLKSLIGKKEYRAEDLKLFGKINLTWALGGLVVGCLIDEEVFKPKKVSSSETTWKQMVANYIGVNERNFREGLSQYTKETREVFNLKNIDAALAIFKYLGINNIVEKLGNRRNTLINKPH